MLSASLLHNVSNYFGRRTTLVLNAASAEHGPTSREFQRENVLKVHHGGLSHDLDPNDGAREKFDIFVHLLCDGLPDQESVASATRAQFVVPHDIPPL